MTQPPDPPDLDAQRAYWTGLGLADLRALERAPLRSGTGFAVPERIPGSEDVPAVAAVLAILEVIGDEGVAVGIDGAFDTATLRAIGARLASEAQEAHSELDAPFVRTARRLAEAAGLIERRMGRVRPSAAGRQLLAGGTDALLPRLLRAWARRPLDAHGPFAAAVHATWPLTVLLLHRFGDRWFPPHFYAALVALLAPGVIAAAPVADELEAREAVLDTFVADMLLRFAAFLGLVELAPGDDADDEAVLRATWLLDALLPLPVAQAPAPEAVEAGEGPLTNTASAFGRELVAALSEQRFETDEQREAFAASFVAERNAAPIEDFDGLSAEGMHRLLYDPFGADAPLVVADTPRVPPRSALLHLSLDLIEALGDAGLKATQRGNLPRAHVLAALERYQAAGWSIEPFLRVRNEEDFFELHVARLVSRMAGLVTLRSGRWHATRAGRRTLERSGAAGVYAALFRAFVRKYAWNWADLYPRLDIVQASWAFSLLLLRRYGQTWRDSDFYAERFVRAFPLAVDEAADADQHTAWPRNPHAAVRHAYEARVLDRFAAFLGLAEVERRPWDDADGPTLRVRATPALLEVVAERTAR